MNQISLKLYFYIFLGSLIFINFSLAVDFQYEIGDYKLQIQHKKNSVLIQYSPYYAPLDYYLKNNKYEYPKNEAEVWSFIQKQSQTKEEALYISKVYKKDYQFQLELFHNNANGFSSLYNIDHELINRVIYIKAVHPFIFTHRDKIIHLYEALKRKHGPSYDSRAHSYFFKSEEGSGYYKIAALLGEGRHNSRSKKYLHPPLENEADQRFFSEKWKQNNKPIKFPKNIKKLQLDFPLIVNHASKDFDHDMEAKAGIDNIIQHFRHNNKAIVFLSRNYKTMGWYTNYRDPDYNIYSYGGENSIIASSGNVVISGGYFGNEEVNRGCLTNAMEYLAHNYFQEFPHQKTFNIHLPISAIYYYNDPWGDEQGNYMERELLKDFESNPKYLLRNIPNLFFYNEEGIDNLGAEKEFIELNRENASLWEFGAEWASVPQTPLDKFTIVAVVNGKEVEKVGIGQKFIRLHFYKRASDIELQ